jgi:hypothetical protein
MMPAAGLAQASPACPVRTAPQAEPAVKAAQCREPTEPWKAGRGQSAQTVRKAASYTQPAFGPHESQPLPMTIFYWTMVVLIVGTLAPSVIYLVLYAVTGEDACMRRARALWNVSRVLAMLGFNLLIWGHVVVGLWQIWFH